jgi:hypothetical protein
METLHHDCLHCLVVREVGRRLESGEICGRKALEKLMLVMADILAMASIDDVEHTAKEFTGALVDLVAQARQRIDGGLVAVPQLTVGG